MIGTAGDGQQPEHREQSSDFVRVVGALTDGALTFDAPFDLASSVALAHNTRQGPDAMTHFDLNRDGVCYDILIVEKPTDSNSGIQPREIINCTVANRYAAAALLGSLAEEFIDDTDEQTD